MGCDIHVYVEKKKNGKWEAVKGKNPWIAKYKEWAARADTNERKESLLKSAKEMEEKESKILSGWIYAGRNYNLFSILAGVRNYYNIKPISKPRGIPKDVSDVIRREYEEWDCDGHSHSWLSFKELLEFDWKNNYIENEGFVSEEVYKQFKETGNPYPCSGDVSGKDIEKILNYEMDRILKDKYAWERSKKFYTAIKWKVTYKEIAEELNKFETDNLDDYRLVFWFDN